MMILNYKTKEKRYLNHFIGNLKKDQLMQRLKACLLKAKSRLKKLNLKFKTVNANNSFRIQRKKTTKINKAVEATLNLHPSITLTTKKVSLRSIDDSSF